MVALTVLWNEKTSDLMRRYLYIFVWCHLSSELTSPVMCSPRAEGPSLCSKPQVVHQAHKKPEYEYGFIPYKKIVSKSPLYLSIDAVLSPSLCIVWEFLSGQCVLLHCSNESLEYHTACSEPLWCHNGFCDVINAQSQQNKWAHP